MKEKFNPFNKVKNFFEKNKKLKKEVEELRIKSATLDEEIRLTQDNIDKTIEQQEIIDKHKKIIEESMEVGKEIFRKDDDEEQP